MNGFNFFANAEPQPDSNRYRQNMSRYFRDQIMGQQSPQNIGQGLLALGDGFLTRQAQQNSMFPSAPGGQQPSFMTGLANFFSGNQNGGLY